MDAEFRSVINAFKVNARLTASELQDFQISDIKDVSTALATIQMKQEKRKRLVYLKRIEPFLQTMREFGKVVEVFLNSSDILGFVWGPIKFLLMLFRSNWKGFRSEINLLKGNMERHKRLLETGASLNEFESMQDFRRSAEMAFKEAKEAESRRRRAAVFDWLSPPNVEAIHERHVKSRSENPDSCLWIFQNGLFKQWFDDDHCSIPLLWINGKPGAGKSVLSSVIIEEAKKSQRVSVAYFYCSFRDMDGPLLLARSILAQLLVQIQKDSLLRYFEDKMSQSGGHGILLSPAVAQEILEMALKSSKTLLVLDGIDEYERGPRKEICAWFRRVIDSLSPQEYGDIRCLFVSQDDGIARKDLATLPTISITPSHNKADITTFTRQWQFRIDERFGPLEAHGISLVEIVPARSQGVFIFAKCVLEELYQQPSRKHLLSEWSAEKFPTQLEQVYDRILHRLMDSEVSQQKGVMRKLLSWVSLCKRPFRWFEIQAAISINPEDDGINEEGATLVDTCKDLCGSFVEVHSDQTVELVHGTVREFLKRRETIVELQVDLELCLMSLEYLSFSDFDASFTRSSVVASLLSGRYAFYEYAVSCWFLHLMSWLGGNDHAQPSIDELLDKLEQFLDQHFVRESDGVQRNVSKLMHESFHLLQDFHLYDDLIQAVVWSKKQLLVENANDNAAPNTLDFPNVTSYIRVTLEDMARNGLTAQQKPDLELYYGSSYLFKCPKMYCRHFSCGLSSQEDRDRHVSRHERAYTCTFEGCPTATFGCLTPKELEAHMLESHGITTVEDEFPHVSKPNATAEGRVTERHVFKCHLCPKRFTRKFALRGHLRTHTDERPYPCLVCGRTFARAHDQRTHTKRQCSEKRFQCRGVLRTGSQWGCGRGFAQAADFVKHLKSLSGKTKCVAPLEAQPPPPEVAAGGDPGDDDAMEVDTPTITYSFPQALVGQYPELAAFNDQGLTG